LSHDLQLNCVISFFFYLHLVLHICAARFDVIGTVALFGFTFYEINRLYGREKDGWGMGASDLRLPAPDGPRLHAACRCSGVGCFERAVRGRHQRALRLPRVGVPVVFHYDSFIFLYTHLKLLPVLSSHTKFL
jgi:hypothetical protein